MNITCVFGAILNPWGKTRVGLVGGNSTFDPKAVASIPGCAKMDFLILKYCALTRLVAHDHAFPVDKTD